MAADAVRFDRGVVRVLQRRLAMNATPSIALTCDLEDTHHGLGLSAEPSSFERDLDWILATFDDLGLRGTFFVLGEIAEMYPAAVQRIARAGHEIGFHGMTHRFLADEGPLQFAAGLANGVTRLEDLTGTAVRGFRAPYFSLAPRTAWCLEALARRGFRYDASIYPGRNDRYGWPGAPATPVVHGPTGIVLFPVPLLHPLLPIGFSGGAYLRILPWRVVRWGFRRSRLTGAPGMIYFHPWEIAPLLPWRRDASTRANVTRHLFRRRMRGRLVRLLASVSPQLRCMSAVVEELDDVPVWTPGSLEPSAPRARA
jgi:polysaccharide deacetylase family protein (PEP-CTERM system associated)